MNRNREARRRALCGADPLNLTRHSPAKPAKQKLARPPVEYIGNLTRVVAAIHGRNKLAVRQSMAAYTDREVQRPYQDEIADHLGASSRGFVHRVLKSLETKGHVRIRMFERRGVELA
jgi:hypothetical protein